MTPERRSVDEEGPSVRCCSHGRDGGRAGDGAVAAAMAKFENAQLEQLAHNVANRGALLPRNLTAEQRRAVMAMVSRVNPSL